MLVKEQRRQIVIGAGTCLVSSIYFGRSSDRTFYGERASEDRARRMYRTRADPVWLERSETKKNTGVCGGRRLIIQYVSYANFFVGN